MNKSDFDRNLLFGILALQVDLIKQADLVAAMAKWDAAGQGAGKLGEILTEQQALAPELREVLEPMVEAHIQRHGGDATECLARLSSTQQLQETLHQIADQSATLRDEVSRLSQETEDFRTSNQATLDFSSKPGSLEQPNTAQSSRFRILRPHARGGLGEVYLARDNELGREVALKEILAEKAGNQQLRARFMIEAEINGNLEHPGIVPVYGLGSYPDGRPFYAMRFIEGDSLKQAIERFHDSSGHSQEEPRAYDSLAFRQLLRRFVDVCNAIAYAHSRGVLHRDLKPANIMLGQYGETLVIDWGLAKATGRSEPGVDSASASPLLPASGSSIEETEHGSTIGTPAFMSPEQAAGKLDELGPASDLYSLGATLYALLTGKPPVQGAHAAEVLSRVRSGSIQPPEELIPAIPRPLSAICLKALALRPQDRYPAAKALADDVERWLADEPVSADREPWQERLRRWGRRHRTLVSTGATAAVLALAGLGIVAVLQARSRQELSNKNDQLMAANQARGLALEKANGRVDLALTALGEFREAVDANLDVQNRPENTALRDALLETPLSFFRTLRDDLATDTNAQPEDRLKLAEAQFELARLTRDIGNQEAAVAAAGEAVATLEALIKADGEGADVVGADAGRTLLGAIALHATLLGDNGKGEEAKAAIDRGVELGNSLVAESGDVQSRIGLAQLLDLSAKRDDGTGQVDSALESLTRARTLLEDVNPDDEDEALEVQALQVQLLNRTAGLQSDKGNPSQAIETLESAILLLRPQTEGPEPSWEARTLLGSLRLNIGENREKLDRISDALEDYKRSLEVRRAMMEERPANLANRLSVVSSLRTISRAQAELGQSETSLETLGEARELLESARVENPRNVPVLNSLVLQHQSIGGSLYNLGRVDESLANFEQALKIQEELVRIEPDVTNNRVNQAGNLYNIAVLRKMVGNFEGSLEADRAALAIRRDLAAAYTDKPQYLFQVAASLGNIGATHASNVLEKRDNKAAMECFREASSLLAGLEAANPDVAAYSEYLARSRMNLSSILVRLGRDAEGLEVLKAAEPYFSRRVQQQPERVQARIDLAGNLLNQATIHDSLRRPVEAERPGSARDRDVSGDPRGESAKPASRGTANGFVQVIGKVGLAGREAGGGCRAEQPGDHNREA